MGVNFLKVVILAAVSDGEIQSQELEIINAMKKSHPMMKNVSDDEVQAAMADIYNKISAGTNYVFLWYASDVNHSPSEC